MTTEHDPYEAGLGFAVRPGSYPGAEALAGKRDPARRLVPLLLDDPAARRHGQGAGLPRRRRRSATSPAPPTATRSTPASPTPGCPPRPPNRAPACRWSTSASGSPPSSPPSPSSTPSGRSCADDRTRVRARAATGTSTGSSLIPTLPGSAYTDPAVFVAEQERIFEPAWACVALAADLDKPGRVPEGAGRAGERAARPRPRRRRAGLPQRLPPPRRAAVHRGVRRAAAQPAVPLPRLDLRPHRQAHRRAQPDVHARRRPRRVRPAQGARHRVARLRLGVPGRPAAVLRRRGARRGHRAPGHPGRDRRLRRGGAGAGPAHHLRRRGQLEAHHRELHGVLPLRDDPPRADRGAAGVRRRLRRPVLRRPRRRVRRRRPGLHRRRPRRASSACPASPTTRTAATTPSPSSPACSSTWCPTTSSCTG